MLKLINKYKQERFTVQGLQRIIRHAKLDNDYAKVVAASYVLAHKQSME